MSRTRLVLRRGFSFAEMLPRYAIYFEMGSNVVSIARRTLGRDFFERRPQAVARELLGAYLVRRADERLTKSFMITETEAYDGPDDLACHASRGRTKRTEVMFGPPGHWYVYFELMEKIGA